MYYIPIYNSDYIEFDNISNNMRLISWKKVPNKVKQLLRIYSEEIPETVAVTESNPIEIVCSEINVLAFIYDKSYVVNQWSDGDTVHHEFPLPCLMQHDSMQKIKNECMVDFLKIALSKSHDDNIQRMISTYYEIRYWTRSAEVKILMLYSLLEFIVNMHDYDKLNIYCEDWKNNTLNSFLHELVSNNYSVNETEAKKSDKYNLLSTTIGQLKDKALRQKIIELCEICKLSVSDKILGDIIGFRNKWVHGSKRNNGRIDELYISLEIIVQMIMLYELSGRDVDYQKSMCYFHDKRGIVSDDNF